MQIRRIVVATDFSEIAERAARHAFDLAATHGAQVFLVHAVDLGGLVTVGPGGIEPYVDLVTISRAIRNEAQQKLEAFVKKLKCPVTVRPEVHAGAPADVVLNVAEERNADLIVCGTHGRSGLKRMLFGSVAEKVLRSTHRPVLMIPGAVGAESSGSLPIPTEAIIDDGPESVAPTKSDEAAESEAEEAAASS